MNFSTDDILFFSAPLWHTLLMIITVGTFIEHSAHVSLRRRWYLLRFIGSKGWALADKIFECDPTRLERDRQWRHVITAGADGKWPPGTSLQGLSNRFRYTSEVACICTHTTGVFPHRGASPNKLLRIYTEIAFQ